HAEHIGRLMLHARDEHSEECRELLELLRRILRHDGQVLRFTCGFVHGICNVAECNSGEFNEVPEDGKGVMPVGELADGFFEGGQVVCGCLWWWFRTRLCRHARSL